MHVLLINLKGDHIGDKEARYSITYYNGLPVMVDHTFTYGLPITTTFDNNGG